MFQKPKNNYPETDCQSGFSLVELLISMVVFLIFMSAVYGLLRIGNIQRSSVSSQTEVIKNARLSLNTIGRDAVNAGFGYSRVGGHAPDNLTNLLMGLPEDTDTEQDLIPAIISGDQINENDFLPDDDATDVVSFIFRDLAFNGGDTIRFINAEDFGGNGVKITTAPNEAAGAQPFDLYLITDDARTALGLVTSVPNSNTIIFQTGGADPLGVNAPYDGSPDVHSRLKKCSDPTENGCFDYANIVSAKRVTWVSYSVNADGTMVRTLYGNNSGQPADEQIRSQPIAFNVQDLQIRYLLKDGTLTDDPSNAGDNQQNLNSVVQVDVTVTTRVRVQEGNVDQIKLINLNSTFSTKNLDYDIS